MISGKSFEKVCPGQWCVGKAEVGEGWVSAVCSGAQRAQALGRELWALEKLEEACISPKERVMPGIEMS